MAAVVPEPSERELVVAATVVRGLLGAIGAAFIGAPDLDPVTSVFGDGRRPPRDGLAGVGAVEFTRNLPAPILCHLTVNLSSFHLMATDRPWTATDRRAPDSTTNP